MTARSLRIQMGANQASNQLVLLYSNLLGAYPLEILCHRVIRKAGSKLVSESRAHKVPMAYEIDISELQRSQKLTQLTLSDLVDSHELVNEKVVGGCVTIARYGEVAWWMEFRH